MTYGLRASWSPGVLGFPNDASGVHDSCGAGFAGDGLGQVGRLRCHARARDRQLFSPNRRSLLAAGDEEADGKKHHRGRQSAMPNRWLQAVPDP